MSSQRSGEILCSTLKELIKKILLSICEVNVKYIEKLEICGSIHIRADGRDVLNFLLAEQSVESKSQTELSSANAGIAYQQDMDCDSFRSALQDVKPNIIVPLTPETFRNAVNTDISDAIELSSDTEDKTRRKCKEKNYTEEYNSPSNRSDDVEPSHISSFTSQPCIPRLMNVCDQAFHSVNTSHQTAIPSATDTLSSPTDPSTRQSIQSFPDHIDCNLQTNLEIPVNERSRNTDERGERVVDRVISRCAICMKTCSSDLLLRLHMQRLHPNCLPHNSFYCKECKAMFRNLQLFNAHKSSCQLSINPITSGDDGVGVRMNHKHSKITSNNKTRYKCTVCSSVLATKDGLQCHMNSIHSRKRIWHCNMCNKTYFSRQALYNHKKTFHRHRNTQIYV